MKECSSFWMDVIFQIASSNFSCTRSIMNNNSITISNSCLQYVYLFSKMNYTTNYLQDTELRNPDRMYRLTLWNDMNQFRDQFGIKWYKSCQITPRITCEISRCIPSWRNSRKIICLWFVSSSRHHIRNVFEIISRVRHTRQWTEIDLCKNIFFCEFQKLIIIQNETSSIIRFRWFVTICFRKFH